MNTLKLGARLVGMLFIVLIFAILMLEMARGKKEGIAGASGFGQINKADTDLAVEGLSTLYRFSGVSDDGEQGSTNRRKATSVHCTNIGSTDTQVEVQVFQYNGTDVFTGTVTMPPNRTFTFSTQNTAIYFEDIVLGGVPGTDAIYQGSGRVLSSNPGVICTAQVLDPLNIPPVFMEALPMHNADGSMVGDIRKLYLPLIRK